MFDISGICLVCGSTIFSMYHVYSNLYDIGKEDDVHESLHDQLGHPIQELTSDERQVISDVSMDGSCCSGDDSSVCSEEEYEDLLMPQYVYKKLYLF